MGVVLGPDKVVVLLPRPDVGPAAGVSQPEEGVIPVHLPSLVSNPSPDQVRRKVSHWHW